MDKIFEFINGPYDDEDSTLGSPFVDNALNSPLFAMGNNVAESSAFNKNSIFYTNTSIEFSADFNDRGNDLNKLSTALADNLKNKSFVFNYEDYEKESVPDLLKTNEYADKMWKKFMTPPVSEFNYKNDDNHWRTGTFFPVQLNKRVGNLDPSIGSSFFIDAEYQTSSFTVSVYYADTRQFRTLHPETPENDFSIDEKYRAIRVSTIDPSAFIGFMDSFYKNSNARSRIREEFKTAYEFIKAQPQNSDLGSTLNWYYGLLPDYLLKEHTDLEMLYDHLTILLLYDAVGFFRLFIDSGNAVIKVLKAITTDDKGKKFLYDKFNSEPAKVKLIYEHLSKSGHSSLHDDEEVPHKTFFAALITAICELQNAVVLNTKGRHERNRTDIRFTSSPSRRPRTGDGNDPNKIYLFEEVQEQRTVTLEPGQGQDKFTSGGEVRTFEKSVWKVTMQNTSFHPMDMVTYVLEDADGIAIEYTVPAIAVYDEAYHAEWDRLMQLLRVAGNLIMIIGGVALLASGVGGLLAVLSIVDLGLATGDLVVMGFEEELRKTPEGRAFLDTWNTIYAVGGGVTGLTLLPGLLRVGGKLIVGLINAPSAIMKQTLKMIEFALRQSVELAQYLKGKILIIANVVNYTATFGKKLANRIAVLQRQGVILMKVTSEGSDAGSKFVLTYKQRVIAQGVTKADLEKAVGAFFNKRNKLIIGALDSLGLVNVKIAGLAKGLEDHIRYLEVEIRLADPSKLKYVLGADGKPSLVNGKRVRNPDFYKESYLYYVGRSSGRTKEEIGKLQVTVYKASGFHMYPNGTGGITAKIVKTKKLITGEEALIAKLEFYCSELGNWVTKKNLTTLFPKNWSYSKIKAVIKEASENVLYLKGNKGVGITKDGIQVEFYLDAQGYITSAYLNFDKIKIY